MTIVFTGDIPSSTERIETGFYSFDRALGDQIGNIGFPLQSLVEVYGPKGIGKTTFCLSMLGLLANLCKTNVDILDLEIQDRETVQGVLANSNFSGKVNYTQNLSSETPEETLSRFTHLMAVDNPNMGLIDSIGAYSPNAELEGEIGDRNVGLKPHEIGQFSGRLIRALQLAKKKNSIFMINHEHPTIGAMIAGMVTGGGVKKKYLSHIRIRVKNAFVKGSTINFGNSWLMDGHIENNRYGYSGRTFYMFMFGGQGVHKGLTWMWECIANGYAEVSTKTVKETSVVNMDGNSFGRISKILEKKDDEKFFLPFYNTLKANELTKNTGETEDLEETDEIEPTEKKGRKNAKKVKK